MPLKIMFLVMLLGSCGMAFWKGRDSERLTALALLLCAVASPFMQTSQFWEPETGILLIDALLLAFLGTLALRSDRFWPLYATGFHIVGTSIHVARLVDGTIWHSAYATGQIFWSYPVLLTLCVGTWLEARYREE